MAKELYVGHLSGEVTEEDLRKLFSVMGIVTSVHLIVDNETGEFKRCGYVRMAANVDPDEVVRTLDGALLIDKVITVSIARPQKELKAAKLAGKPKTGKFGFSASGSWKTSGNSDAKPGSRRSVARIAENSDAKPESKRYATKTSAASNTKPESKRAGGKPAPKQFKAGSTGRSGSRGSKQR